MRTKKNFYSSSQKIIQKKYKGFKVAEALLKNRVHNKLLPEYKSLIKKSRFFIISTIGEKYPEVSIKSGYKGFLKIINSNLLEFIDYDGNRMFRTIGNIKSNHFISLLIFDLDMPDTKDKPNTPVKLRILGKAKCVTKNKIRLIRISIDFAFSNCPRYLPNYKFISDSKFVKNKKLTPEWKKRSYIKNIL